MSSPSCIVENGQLSPVGQRNLALFQAQSIKPLLVVLMSDANMTAGYFGPDPSSQEPSAWMLPFRQAGIAVGINTQGLRIGTKLVIVLTAAQWLARKQMPLYRDGVFQVWGDGGEAWSWPVMPPEPSPSKPR